LMDGPLTPKSVKPEAANTAAVKEKASMMKKAKANTTKAVPIKSEIFYQELFDILRNPVLNLTNCISKFA
jgi:hypothetical protein